MREPQNEATCKLGTHSSNTLFWKIWAPKDLQLFTRINKQKLYIAIEIVCWMMLPLSRWGLKAYKPQVANESESMSVDHRITIGTFKAIQSNQQVRFSFLSTHQETDSMLPHNQLIHWLLHKEKHCCHCSPHAQQYMVWLDTAKPDKICKAIPNKHALPTVVLDAGFSVC